jgi:putative spermidine/putrescine transport system ATP-binding protein
MTQHPALSAQHSGLGAQEYLVLEGLEKSYSATPAVRGLELAVGRGEFISLLGPSGCGKTTTLRLLAGLEEAAAGRILLDGEDITRLHANRRGMGMVFQAYALFPNMSVADNIGFGLRIARRPPARLAERVAELLELIGLEGYGARYPHQLSGGQQQRVALARAVAPEPRVLLLDEPLSALDAQVRQSLRTEIRRIQQRLGITTVYVTHDQEEALSISDRVVVMNQGRIEQVGRPEDIYSNPQTLFTASFVGATNQLPARLTARAEGRASCGHFELRLPALDPALCDDDDILVLVRPEDITLGGPEAGGEAENHLTGVVEVMTFLGPVTRLEVVLEDGAGSQPVKVDIPSERRARYPKGSSVTLAFRAATCRVMRRSAAPSD